MKLRLGSTVRYPNKMMAIALAVCSVYHYSSVWTIFWLLLCDTDNRCCCGPEVAQRRTIDDTAEANPPWRDRQELFWSCLAMAWTKRINNLAHDGPCVGRHRTEESISSPATLFLSARVTRFSREPRQEGVPDIDDEGWLTVSGKRRRHADGTYRKEVLSTNELRPTCRPR